jgi:hypothetical protein
MLQATPGSNLIEIEIEIAHRASRIAHRVSRAACGVRRTTLCLTIALARHGRTDAIPGGWMRPPCGTIDVLPALACPRHRCSASFDQPVVDRLSCAATDRPRRRS